MKCPVCQNEMVEKDFGGIKVDFCENGCKGIWFDWFELSKLDEKTEGAGEALKEALGCQSEKKERKNPVDCPKCGIPMHEHKYQSSKEVNVDECYNCGGFFLDAGELRAIRDNFMSDKEREAYAQKLAGDVPEFVKAQEDLDREKVRIRAIKGLTKFLRLKS